MIESSNIEELKEIIGIVALLVYFEFVDSNGNKTEYYFNNSNDDLFVDGMKYIAMGFDVEEFEMQAGINVDSIELIFDNVSLFPASVLLNHDQRGQKAEVAIAIFDKYGQQLGVKNIWSGFIIETDLNETKARIRIGHEFVFWRKYTLSKYTYDKFPNLKAIDEKQIWWGRKV